MRTSGAETKQTCAIRRGSKSGSRIELSSCSESLERAYPAFLGDSDLMRRRRV